MTREEFEQRKLTDNQFYQMCEYIKEDVINSMNDTAAYDAKTAPTGVFKEALENVRPNEIAMYMLLNMPSSMFEFKTMSYKTWSKGPYHHENMIELWKNAWEGEDGCKPASLFATKAKWWIREFVQQDGSSIYSIIEVEALKAHYETIKHLKAVDGTDNDYFRYINKGKGWDACWCMRMNWFDGKIMVLEKQISYLEALNQKLIEDNNNLKKLITNR